MPSSVKAGLLAAAAWVFCGAANATIATPTGAHSTAGTSATNTLVPSADCPVGSYVVLAVLTRTTNAQSVSDVAGNSWTQSIASVSDGASNHVSIWTTTVTSDMGVGDTVTFGATSSLRTAAVLACLAPPTGLNTTPLDVTGTAVSGTTTSGTPITAATLTPTHSTDIVFAWFDSASTSVTTEATGFTSLGSAYTSGTLEFRLAYALPSGGSVSYAPTPQDTGKTYGANTFALAPAPTGSASFGLALKDCCK